MFVFYNNKRNMSNFILNENNDFTVSKLVEFLNDKFKSKKTGSPFTTGDIHQYLRRGFLPKKYGHHPIESIENEDIGVKLVRVYFKKTVK